MRFETFAGRRVEEFGRAPCACLDALPLVGPREGLSLYLDRVLEHGLKHPEPLQLIRLDLSPIGLARRRSPAAGSSCASTPGSFRSRGAVVPGAGAGMDPGSPPCRA